MANIYTGQNSEFVLVSQTHGKYSAGYVESFNADVSHANKRLYFFNKKEALAISIFEGVNGQFGYLETEERYILAALADVDPAADLVNDDPSAYYAFNLILNVRNEAGVVENGIFVKGCRVAGNPDSIAPREEQHGQMNYIAATKYKIKGGGIQYSRLVGATPAYDAIGDILATASGSPSMMTATILTDAIAVNIENKTTTRNYLAVFKNGTDITKDAVKMAGVTVVDDVISIPAANFTATDVWEFYTPYKPV